jgi:hypothetical protein
MSSAIALSQKPVITRKRTYTSAFEYDNSLNNHPRRFTSIEEACKIPDKPIRDALIKVYFEHFHSFCPVVNEVDFMEVYDGIRDDEQLIKRIDLTLFQAMMFVAIAVGSLEFGTPLANFNIYSTCLLLNFAVLPINLSTKAKEHYSSE